MYGEHFLWHTGCYKAFFMVQQPRRVKTSNTRDEIASQRTGAFVLYLLLPVLDARYSTHLYLKKELADPGYFSRYVTYN